MARLYDFFTHRVCNYRQQFFALGLNLGKISESSLILDKVISLMNYFERQSGVDSLDTFVEIFDWKIPGVRDEEVGFLKLRCHQ